MSEYRYFEVLKNTQLESVFAEYLKSKSTDAPYHNANHTARMIELCFEGLCYEQSKNNKQFSGDEVCNLICAAILHDVNHSKGLLADEYNIKIALFYLEKINVPDFIDKEKVADIIKATQYPYVIENDKLDIFQKIIRDADLMSRFDDTFLQFNIIGLAHELNIDIKQMIDGAKEFGKNIKWNTSWGKHVCCIKETMLNAEIDFLKNITR